MKTWRHFVSIVYQFLRPRVSPVVDFWCATISAIFRGLSHVFGPFSCTERKVGGDEIRAFELFLDFFFWLFLNFYIVSLKISYQMSRENPLAKRLNTTQVWNFAEIIFLCCFLKSQFKSFKGTLKHAIHWPKDTKRHSYTK